MNKFFLYSALLVMVSSCDPAKKATKFKFETPVSGAVVNTGTKVPLTLAFPSGGSIDSVIYAVGGEFLVKKTDTSSVLLDTDNIGFGNRTLSARLYQGGQEQTANSNIVVVPPLPTRYTFKVINEYPHDPLAYTQGLEYENGFLYESTGGGRSGIPSLRKVNYKTGEVVKKKELESHYFAEGLTIVGDKIIQLTWENKVGFVYNKNTFEKIAEFPYGNSKEGWGIAFDGERFIKSDGTNKLYFLNKDTFEEEGFVEVYGSRGPVDSLNELEYVDGKIYANVYQEDIIVIIDPQTGAIEGEINLIGINPGVDTSDADYVANGIAYHQASGHFFVTGKLWDKLYEIAVIPR